MYCSQDEILVGDGKPFCNATDRIQDLNVSIPDECENGDKEKNENEGGEMLFQENGSHGDQREKRGEGVNDVRRFSLRSLFFHNTVMKMVMVTFHDTDGGVMFDIPPEESAPDGEEYVENRDPDRDQGNKQTGHCHCFGRSGHTGECKEKPEEHTSGITHKDSGR